MVRYMARLPFLFAFLCLFLSTVGVFGAATEGPVRSEYVEAELVSEMASIQPGVPFWVAVSLRHDPHWHTYWVNPADSGLETMLVWDLPDGFEAGEIQWPYPEYIEMGGLVTYGFERDVLLLVEITPPADLDPGDSVTLKVRADWLECKEICLPGGADLALTLDVASDDTTHNEDWVERFSTARAELPLEDVDWSFEGHRADGRLTIHALSPDWFDGEITDARFYALDPELVEYLPPQNWSPTDRGYAFELIQDTTYDHQPDRIRGVLVSEDGWRGPGSEKALYVDVELSEEKAGIAAALPSAPSDVSGFAVALVFAFLGGLILNLMPCVFPIISIKVMGFVRQAQEEHAAVWKHGALFAFGVLVSFWVLAGLLIALRAGGEQLGWGFHLQSPIFLIGMSVLFFLLGLNLFGVFEVGTAWLGLGQKATSSASWTGSFFSGALATVIATPCTAPFMGAALGYALTLSPVEALLIFTFLGLGMASPYVLLSAFPQWLSRVPKPGPWMETLKQSMGWLLVATVVWLAWVLNIMAGGEAVIVLIGVLFLVGLGGWVLGRWGVISRAFPVRLTAKIIASVLMLGGLVGGVVAADRLAPVELTAGTAGEQGGVQWEPFTEERLEAVRAEGKPVFINFTAAWCLTCQVNERVAFSSARVREAFEERGVIALKADWTNRDDTIGRVLEGYGRNSIPFYVLYGKGPEATYTTLPEILRPGTVLDALDKL